MSLQLTILDREFPVSLKFISRPPQTLWIVGEVACLSEGKRVAIVGARACSPYGEDVAFQLARDLAQAGVIVVSGLAYGIDAAAHRGALAGGGKTIAVLGSGIGSTYPAKNQELRKSIERQGAVVTEFSPDQEANEKTFPQRNRIISGLSSGVVVVEAGSESGALITADFAADQGRDVFAVPGDIRSPKSVGTHRLIQQGAKLVMSAEDILVELKVVSQKSLPLFEPLERAEKDFISEDERCILQLLGTCSMHMDDLVDQTGLAVEKMSGILTSLEISGRIRSLPGSRFEKCRSIGREG